MPVNISAWNALSFFRYSLFSRHRKGFGIHSPFLFRFISEILFDENNYPEYKDIQYIRKQLLHSHEMIRVMDFGAGSERNPLEFRKLSDIARLSSTKRKYGELLFRLTRNLKPFHILELGTSLGIGSMYMGMGNPPSKITTVEGCRESARIAATNFGKLGLTDIQIIVNRFEEVLQSHLPGLPSLDMVYIDGDHRLQSVINYFEQLLPFRRNETIFVFDDINWSKEMNSAWQYIKKHPEVRVTIDLWQLGIVFFRAELKKQDFVVKF